VTGQPLSEEEQARRKKAANGYDGTPLEKADRARFEMMQNVNVEEQIRAIHQKFGDKK
jgi:splicing factor 3A subunit 1